MASYKCEHCGYCVCIGTSTPDDIHYCPRCKKAMLLTAR